MNKKDKSGQTKKSIKELINEKKGRKWVIYTSPRKCFFLRKKFRFTLLLLASSTEISQGFTSHTTLYCVIGPPHYPTSPILSH